MEVPGVSKEAASSEELGWQLGAVVRHMGTVPESAGPSTLCPGLWLPPQSCPLLQGSQRPWSEGPGRATDGEA